MSKRWRKRKKRNTRLTSKFYGFFKFELHNKILVMRKSLFRFKMAFSLIHNRFPVHSEILVSGNQPFDLSKTIWHVTMSPSCSVQHCYSVFPRLRISSHQCFNIDFKINEKIWLMFIRFPLSTKQAKNLKLGGIYPWRESLIFSIT